ncbi:hypothetical protein [Paenibacillus ferrarius]|uniref:hypothetical protein n=1 Tax=Paenibacillus ferrarius TaxID=1469647 RepID=UPI003D26D18D
MLVELIEETLLIDNKQGDTVKMLMEKVDQVALLADKLFSHMSIDGIDVYDNIEEYIIENLAEIKRVKVHFSTIEDYYRTSTLEAINYLKNAIKPMESLANQFYIGDSSLWKDCDQLIEGLEWINSFLTFSVGHSEGAGSLKVMQLELSKHIQKLYDAMNLKDLVLVGDIINYELIPFYMDLEKKLKNSGSK